jgi:hypothetical protein
LHNAAALAQFGNGVVPFVRRSGRPSTGSRLADLVALAIVGGCALEASSKLVPGPSPFLQSAFVIAVTALAARRLVEWRHGTSRPLTVQSGPELIFVLAGMAPWLALPILQASTQGAWLGTLTAFGISLPHIGVCLILLGVISPFRQAWRRHRGSAARSEATSGRRVAAAGDDCAHAAGIALVSLNPFLAVLAAGAFAIRWRWSRADRSAKSPSSSALREEAA